MGRKSLLTGQQWEEMRLRLVNGETMQTLAVQFGVSASTIRKHFAGQIKAVTPFSLEENSPESAVHASSAVVKSRHKIDLPTDRRRLAERLVSISDHLCAAAEHNAATARCLSEVARKKAQEIDDAALLDGKTMGTLKAISLMTKMANDASEIGVNLLRANKDVPTAGQTPTPVAIHFGVKDARRDGNDDANDQP